MTDLIDRLRTKAAMIHMGEKIAFGSDTSLMEEAATEIERLREALETARDAMQFYMLPSAMDGGIGECAAVTNTRHALEVVHATLNKEPT